MPERRILKTELLILMKYFFYQAVLCLLIDAKLMCEHKQDSLKQKYQAVKGHGRVEIPYLFFFPPTRCSSINKAKLNFFLFVLLLHLDHCQWRKQDCVTETDMQSLIP